jgi:hypothetical protein
VADVRLLVGKAARCMLCDTSRSWLETRAGSCAACQLVIDHRRSSHGVLPPIVLMLQELLLLLLPGLNMAINHPYMYSYSCGC